MPALTNAKHEFFAQALAKGKSQAEAYEFAGYKPDEPNASRLTRNDKVQARVAEILNRAATRAEITIASLSQELLEAIAAAKAKPEEAAMINAWRQSVMDVAKLNGLIIDKASLDANVRAGVTVEIVRFSEGPTSEQLDPA